MSIMMITHDLGVIAEVSDRVAVMYAGKVVEYTDVDRLFEDPKHPYTWGLMNSIPKLDKDVDRLEAIPGSVPSPLNFPEGCKFNTRCPLAEGKCYDQEPPLEDSDGNHMVRCWRYEDLEEIKKRGKRIYENRGDQK